MLLFLHGTSFAALGGVLEPSGALVPLVGVVVGVHEGHTELLSVPKVLTLPQLVP
jgi:hypothetical protein